MIVYGKPHCITFWQLFSAFRWAQGFERVLKEKEFNDHMATCPACREFERTIPAAYAGEE